jgi:hypothetical protein
MHDVGDVDDDDDKEEVEVEVWPTWTCEACTFTNDDVGEDAVNGQCVMCKCFIAYVESTRQNRRACPVPVCAVSFPCAASLTRFVVAACVHALCSVAWCGAMGGMASGDDQLNQLLAHSHSHPSYAVTGSC